jgi:DUF2934 family protein
MTNGNDGFVLIDNSAWTRQSPDGWESLMAKSATKKNGPVAVTPVRATKSAPSPSITEHDIARRAYHLFLARGCEHGHDIEDWLQAERELKEFAGIEAA